MDGVERARFAAVKHLPSSFPGVQFHAVASKVKKELDMAKTLPVEYVAERLKVKLLSPLSSEDADYAQSGGEIDASMTSACLEEVLNEKGLDMETIYNTTALVYLGISCLFIVPPTLIVSRRNV